MEDIERMDQTYSHAIEKRDDELEKLRKTLAIGMLRQTHQEFKHLYFASARKDNDHLVSELQNFRKAYEHTVPTPQFDALLKELQDVKKQLDDLRQEKDLFVSAMSS